MCDVLDRVEEKGRQEGRLEGRKEGRQEGRKEGRQEGRKEGRQEEKRRTAASLHSMGMTMVTICIRMENIQQIFPE